MSNSTHDYDGVDENGGVRGYDPSFVDVDGVRTRFYDVGDGEETVVLVHGGNWSGLSSANGWAPSFERLAESFRVVAFDRVACGMTDNPDDLIETRYRSELDHALAFAEAMDLDGVHLAGYSRGGGLATRMAVEEPDRFDTLVICNSATLGPETGDSTYRRERLFRGLEAYEPTDPEYTRYYYTQYSHQTDHVTDEFCRTAAYMRSRPKAKQTAEVMDDGGQEVWEQTMRTEMNEAHQRIGDGVLTMPTLYVYGRNDLTVPTGMAMGAYDMLAQANSAVRMTVVNHCGHMVFREHPEEFAGIVEDFVARWH